MGIWGKLTGKELEDKIGQYSEVYGEVLLGMHRELESQKKLLHDYRRDMSSLIDEARRLNKEFESDRRNLQERLASLEKRVKAQSIGLVVLLIICLGLGVLVWIMK